jgi:hypothetical protein
MHYKTYKNGPTLALQGHSHGLAIMMFKGAIWTNKTLDHSPPIKREDDNKTPSHTILGFS